MQGQDHLSLAGIDLEPIEPFCDDVFAGMDEHPAGPWPHHALDPTELQLYQQEHCHFPAIDCNLQEGQGCDSMSMSAHHGSPHSSPADGPQADQAMPSDVLHGDRQRSPACALALPEAPAALDLLEAAHDEAGSSLHHQHAHAIPSEVSQSTVPEQPVAILGNCNTEEQQQQLLQGQALSLTAEHSPGSSQAGGDSRRPSIEPAASSSTDMLRLLEPAGVAGGDGVEAGTADAASPGVVSAAAATVAPPQAADACMGIQPAGPGDDTSAGAAPSGACSDGTACSALAAAGAVIGAAAAADAAGSSGSLPDIDDVPEEQLGRQGSLEQQPADSSALPQLQHASESSTSIEQPGVCEEAAAAAAEGAGSEQQQTCTACPASAPASSKSSGTGSDNCSSKRLDGTGVSVAQAAGALPGAIGSGAAAMQEPAAVDSKDPAAAQFGQQLSMNAEDFASPCSSWHSCITAASKASSLHGSRGFFVPGAAAAAGGAAESSITQHQDAVDSLVQPQLQQQQRSRSGCSTPAMVSSLHLALQEQQQQQQLQHSEHAAPTACMDPLGALSSSNSCSRAAISPDPGTGEFCAAASFSAALTEGHGCGPSSGATGCSSSSTSRPIEVVRPAGYGQQAKREEEPWQSVSPPSFSSSPGLLVSAAAARAAAAAGQQQGPSSTTDAAAADAGSSVAGSPAEGGEVLDDDVGHGHFYAQAPGWFNSPEAALQQRQPGLQQHTHPHMGHSSYVLRQSELVDLSLSTSVHPSQVQQLQQAYPGWLTAHQQLPPAAAQAVERAVVALNDSYCYQGRMSPSDVLGAAAAVSGGAAGVARGAGSTGMGAVAIRRSGAAQQWNKAHTQPQQDQQARHRLPSQTAHAGPAGPFGWPGAVLGDWFSSSVQQPLAAAASRAAVGVGQRLGMAHGPQQQKQQQSVFGRQHSSSNSSRAGSNSSSAGRAVGENSSMTGVAAQAGMAAAAAAVAIADGSEDSMEDAVLIEKTSDLPQSLQEQEDEAFRGLLFLGGRDSQGRPVVIVNTDAIPAGHNAAPRDAALAYLLRRLGPVVTRGPYVLVIVALHNGPQFRLLPGFWCVRAYQSLPRAFRKHVKHVILLQPSMLVKTAVTLLYPFVSSKAHAKVKQVQRLLDIDAATCGEVQVPHLGEAFLTTLHHINTTRGRETSSNTPS